MPGSADTLRVLVATDNHLGYAERDPVRGNDSFRTFREILTLARREGVDFVLLGGDLFHENKPSRRTLYETLRLLRTHCMGDGAVGFQVVSDQSINFPNFGLVNYEDPNFNISLPVFSIHGNHDDPSRESGGGGGGGGAGANGSGPGGGSQSLAALDLLSAANLVNYFGKSDKVDAIEVFPILLHKGATRVAVYGLGNMRDERLHRMFAQQKVVFRRPAENPEEWFSIFVVHQNREDRGRGAKNCLPESFIPKFIDFVIWGHEHECRVDVEESVKGEFFITQPGSSVATSLVEGEAAPKHVAILEVHAQSFRVSKRPLTTVRPFKMTEVVLADVDGLDPNDPEVADRIREHLEHQVLELLAEAEAEATTATATGERSRPPDLREVLVRIRVEHTGFPVLINQRFGSRFVGKVANPNDILLFYRRKKDRRPAPGSKEAKMAAAMMDEALREPIRPQGLDSATIEDFLTQQLHEPSQQLKFLPEGPLAVALEDYIVKNIPSALEEFVDGILDDTQRELRSRKDARSKEDIAKVVEKKKDRANAEQLVEVEEKNDDQAEMHKDDETDDTRPSSRNGFQESFRSQSQSQPVTAARRRRVEEDNGDSDVDDLADGEASSRSNARQTSRVKVKPAGKNRIGRTRDSDSGDGNPEVSSPPVRKRKAPARARTPPSARKPPARAARSKAQAKRGVLLSDEDDIGDDDNDADEDYEVHDDEEEDYDGSEVSTRGAMTKRPTPKRSTKPRAASSSTRKRLRGGGMAESDEDEFTERAKMPRQGNPITNGQSTSAGDEIDLCSSDSESSKSKRKPVSAPASSRARPSATASTSRARQTPQPKISELFRRQQHRTGDVDDLDSDREFTQLNGATATTVGVAPSGQQAPVSPTFEPTSQSQSQAPVESQSQSQAGGAKKRKLPLSMLAVSQSTTPAAKVKKNEAVAASALRKGWGRTRR